MSDSPSFKSDVVRVIGSNLSIVLVSALGTLIVPKLIGAEEFAYWQLFVFYGSYVLMAQLGLAAGSNLRYAGMDREALKSKAVGTQAALLCVSSLLVAVALVVWAWVAVEDPKRSWVMQLVAGFLVITNLRHFVLMQLQSISDFRTFSRITIWDRLLFAGGLTVLLLSGATDFRIFSVTEILSKTITLIVLLFLTRDLLFTRLQLGRALKEIAENVTAGVKLTLASTTNLLIIGVARLLIDRTFGVLFFGAISLVLNISSLFMVFINAVGLVLFPTLRRTDKERYLALYEQLRAPISFLALVILVFIWPITTVVTLWLPDYAAGAQFIAVLLPTIVFESRMGLIVLPFMKALRKENALLAINAAVLLVATLLSGFAALLLQSMALTVLAIPLALALRASIAELLLLRALGSVPSISFWLEIPLVAIIIAAHWFFPGATGMAITVALLGIYFLTVREKLSRHLSGLGRLLR